MADAATHHRNRRVQTVYVLAHPLVDHHERVALSQDGQEDPGGELVGQGAPERGQAQAQLIGCGRGRRQRFLQEARQPTHLEGIWIV